jgi:nicotinamide phosphoribosyltransferase
MNTQYKLNGKTINTRQLDLSRGLLTLMRDMFDVSIDSDSYKYSHFCQYLPGASRMVSYIESRGGEFDRTVNFGVQMLVKEYLMGTMTHERVDNVMAFAMSHMGTFDEKAWRKVVDVYGGKLPVKIRNAKEGLAIPVKNVLVTIESTVDDPDVFSLVSFFETLLLRYWHPVNVATLSWHIWELVYESLERTADNPEAEIPFKLHDFGSRGVGGFQGGAAFGGAGHLVNFMGSDTCAAIALTSLAYHHPMPAYSVNASEHSTTTSWGREGEASFVKNMLNQYAEGRQNPIVATVADSWDIENFVKNILGKQLRDDIVRLHRENGLTYVVRPDSNDPVRMPVQTIKWLDEAFGSTVNSKGFKVLNHGMRVLQGDGINIQSIKNILSELERLGYSASNIVFGMGGALLQKHDRDTQKFAMKCCAVKVNGQWQDVYKNPRALVWDSPDAEPRDEGKDFKASKAGRMTLITNGVDYKTVRIGDDDVIDMAALAPHGWYEALEDVYENGVLLRDMTLDEVRANARASHTRFPVPLAEAA